VEQNQKILIRTAWCETAVRHGNEYLRPTKEELQASRNRYLTPNYTYLILFYFCSTLIIKALFQQRTYKTRIMNYPCVVLKMFFTLNSTKKYVIILYTSITCWNSMIQLEWLCKILKGIHLWRKLTREIPINKKLN